MPSSLLTKDELYTEVEAYIKRFLNNASYNDIKANSSDKRLFTMILKDIFRTKFKGDYISGSIRIVL